MKNVNNVRTESKRSLIDNKNSENNDLACSLDCNDKAKRFETLLEEVFSFEHHLTENKNDFRLTFKNGKPAASTIELFISRESQCCDFLNLSLEKLDNGDNTLVIHFQDQHKLQIKQWLEQLTHASSTRNTADKVEPNTNQSSQTNAPWKPFVVSIGLFGLLCCLAPFIALGLIGLGIGVAISELTITLERLFIILGLISILAITMFKFWPVLLKKLQY